MMSDLERNTDSGAPDEPLSRISSGIAGLDDVLCGGFVRNGIYIVQGLPGAGKTIFGNQICYTQTAAGAAALYVTLLSETYDRMMLNIRRMRFFRPECIAHQLNYISAFRVLEEDGLHGLLNLLRREIVARRPSVLVIDGLLATEHIATSQLELKKFVHELQMQAATGDCTMFLLTSGQSATVSPEHTMVDGMIEFGDQQFGWRAEREILVRKFRGSGYLRGRHAARIDNDGISVFPRIESMFSRPIPNKPASFRRVSTGVAGLDEMLGGGLPEASTTLVLGPTGSGKTAFGLHFLAGSSDDAPGLMVGFYEAPGHLVARAEVLAPGLAAAMRGGAVEMQWCPEAEGHMDEVALRLLDNVRRRGVRRVVIDGLLGFRNLTPHRDRLPSFIRALCNELRALGVTAMFTMEVTEMVGSVVRAPATSLTPIAENLILLRYVEFGAQLRRMVSILKVRDRQFDPRLRSLEIEAGHIAIGGPFDGLQGVLTGFPHPVADEDGAGPFDPQTSPGRGSRRGS